MATRRRNVPPDPAETAARALQHLRADGSVGIPGSPARKRFDTLLRTLERQRGELRAWADALPRWQQRHQEQLAPLLARQEEMEAAMVALLDRKDATIKLAKGDRRFLSELLCGLAEPLIAAGRDDLKPIFDRHSELGYDEESAESDEMLKQAIGAAYGLDPDEVDAAESPEALFENLRARAQQEQQHAQRRQAQRRGRAAAKRAGAEPPPLREIYRKLVATLHPDRARDSTDAERRTRLMQRLNAAYKAGDLIGLIELQAEIGLLDAAGVDAWGEERLKQYNRTLAQQCKDVEHELMQVALGFCDEYGLELMSRPKPESLDKLLAQLKRQVEGELAELGSDLRELEQPQAFKQWLKAQRRFYQHQEHFLDPSRFR